MVKKWLFILLVLPLLLGAEDHAYLKYREGERASNPVERREAFNEALFLYLRMEPDSPSAELCFDIANTYYQLNEFGYAVLYYNKALKENPRFEQARDNLQIALHKINMPSDKPGFLQNYLLFPHYMMSHNEKAITVLLLLFFAFGLLSVHIWVPQDFIKKVAYVALWVALLFFTSIMWADYFTSPRAIVVRPVALRRDAGNEYAPVVGPPALVGTKLIVQGVESDGNWLKVRTSSGEEGYISKEHARVI